MLFMLFAVSAFTFHEYRLSVCLANKETRLLVDVHCGRSERQVDEIQLHVFGWRGSQSLESLLGQHETADYSGWDIPIPLYIHVDRGLQPEVIDVVNEFRWTAGS